MDIIEMLWLPPIRWAISLTVYAIILFFIYHFVARCLRRSKLYKKLRDRFKGARVFPKKKARTDGPKEKENKVVLAEFIKKVRIRGGIRREYLIVLIPAVIGIMVAIFGAVFFVSDQVDSESDALEQIPLSTPLPTPSTTSESGENEPKNRDENAFLLNIVIVIAVLIALAPYGVYVLPKTDVVSRRV